MKRVGALWIKQGKDGEFYSGTLELGALGDVNVMVFPNTRKEKDTEPDFAVCLPGDREKKQ